MEHEQENRKFTRVDFRITATLQIGDKQIKGSVENLSLRGMYVLTDQKPQAGEKAEIVIELSKHPEYEANGLSDDELKIDVDGKIERVTSDGIALSFARIDFDSYVHLKNIVALNTGDASKVDREVDFFLGINPDFLER